MALNHRGKARRLNRIFRMRSPTFRVNRLLPSKSFILRALHQHLIRMLLLHLSTLMSWKARLSVRSKVNLNGLIGQAKAGMKILARTMLSAVTPAKPNRRNYWRYLSWTPKILSSPRQTVSRNKWESELITPGRPPLASRHSAPLTITSVIAVWTSDCAISLIYASARLTAARIALICIRVC
ncbi:hypothetical protein SMKC082_16760 [Serratia marcescens]|nr:hypothetical protein SMKC082_16760 [Serratia marcescens]BEO66231.1 hypothetical protein SMQE31_17390 [Serratia marcescens]